jgi:hypothetical protein
MCKRNRFALLSLTVLACVIGITVLLLPKSVEPVSVSLVPPTHVVFVDDGAALVNSEREDISIPPDTWEQLRILFANSIERPPFIGNLELARLYFDSDKTGNNTIILLNFGQGPVGFRYRGRTYMRRRLGQVDQDPAVDESNTLLYLLHSYCTKCSSDVASRRRDYLEMLGLSE